MPDGLFVLLQRAQMEQVRRYRALRSEAAREAARYPGAAWLKHTAAEYETQAAQQQAINARELAQLDALIAAREGAE